MNKKISALFFILAAGMLTTACDDDDEIAVKSCISNSDCFYPMEVCMQGQCVSNNQVVVPATCNNDSECQSGESCQSHKCVKNGCNKPEDCKDGETCDMGKCVPESDFKCHTDADCSSHGMKNHKCKNNVCVANPVEEKPQLTFEPTYGSGTGQFTKAQSWRAIVGQYGPRNPLYVMLCAESDETCKSPLKIIKLGAEHGYNIDDKKDNIQSSFGPKIKISGLDEGTYNMMVIADSEISIKNGMGFDDMKAVADADWGGKVSETDLMLSEEKAKDNYNPPPKAKLVTIKNGETADLGKLTLSHFYERDISTHPDGENGRLVVAISTGLRMVDLNDYSLIPAYEEGETKYYDYQMVNDADEVVPDMVCGIIKSSDELVWTLYLASSYNGHKVSGYAIPFNPKTGKQIGNKAVEFPEISKGQPCKGISHTIGKDTYLFVANYPGPETAEEGLWTVKIPNSKLTENITANKYDSKTDLFYKAGSYALAAYENTLYSVPVPSNDTKKLDPCGEGNVCAFKLDINTEDGSVKLKKKEDKYELLNAGNMQSDVYNAKGEKLYCNPNKFTTPGMGIGGKFLFLSRCNDMAVYDLSKKDANGVEEAVDMDGGKPGKGKMPSYLYGQAMHDFTLSPDKKTLWGVAANSSLIKLYVNKEDADGTKKPVSYDRLAAMPIDITGDVPVIAKEFNKDNVDNYEGAADGQKLQSPKIDPGLDLTNFRLHQYIVNLYPSLQGSTPYFTVTAPKITVANNTLWIGNTSHGVDASFGQYADLAVFDIKAKQSVMFGRPQYEEFFRVFSNGVDGKRLMGYPLVPNSAQSIESYGAVYVNMD